MVADPAANAGQGIDPAVDLQGFLEVALGDQSDIRASLGADRAGVVAGRGDQVVADSSRTSLVFNVSFVFVPEIAERG